MTVERHFKVVGGKDLGQSSPPNQSVIDMLEEAMRLAKNGTLQELHLCGITDDHVAVQGYSSTGSVYTMLGALVQATTDFQNREIMQYSPETI